MTEKKFLQLSFLLPLLVPLPFTLIPSLVSGGAKDWLMTPAMFLLGSLIIGGIPYLLFLGGVLTWSWNRSANQICIFTWVAPLIFAPACLLFFVIPGLFFGSRDVDTLLLIIACVLIIGYGYVIVINVLFRLFYRCRWKGRSEYATK